MFDTQRVLLSATLAAAVPMWVQELLAVRSLMGCDRLFFCELQRRAARCSAVLAHNGDALLFRQKGKVVEQGKGKEPVVIASTAEAFNRLAEGVACMAFCPDGVKALGTRYRVDGGTLVTEYGDDDGAPLALPDADLFTPFTDDELSPVNPQ